MTMSSLLEVLQEFGEDGFTREELEQVARQFIFSNSNITINTGLLLLAGATAAFTILLLLWLLSYDAYGYGVSGYGYGALPSGYGIVPSGYGAPHTGYVTPPTGYGAPHTGYGYGYGGDQVKQLLGDGYDAIVG